MQKDMFIRLVLPLISISVAGVAIHNFWGADGFFLNLSTEMVGIIVTVGYVDWVIRSNNLKSWRGAQSRINERIRYLANSTITTIRISLGYGTDVFDQKAFNSMNVDVKAMNEEVLRVATHILKPSTNSRLKKLDVNGWKILCDRLQLSCRELEQLLDRFGHRLNPEDIEALLDLQQSLKSSMLFREVFPDIAGIPDENLPKTNTDTVALKSAWIDISARSLSEALELCVMIGRRCDRANKEIS